MGPGIKTFILCSVLGTIDRLRATTDAMTAKCNNFLMIMGFFLTLPSKFLIMLDVLFCFCLVSSCLFYFCFYYFFVFYLMFV